MISVALRKKEKGHKIECDKLKSLEKKSITMPWVLKHNWVYWIE